jgi:TetR/AcrR family transcriptional regulator
MRNKKQKRERLSRGERRQQILDVAIKLFARKGFNGTRTREIAEMAGISEALLFQFFRSKEELFKATLEELYRPHTVLHTIEEKMEEKDDYSNFKDFALHMIKHYRKNPRIVRLSIFGALEYPKLVEMYHGGGETPQSGEELLANYIQQRIDKGIFKKVNAQVAAQLFLDSIDFYIINQELFKAKTKTSVSDEEIVDTFVRIYLDGLRKK